MFQTLLIYKKSDEEKAGAGRDKEGARMYSSCEPKAPRGPGRPGATGAPRGPGKQT